MTEVKPKKFNRSPQAKARRVRVIKRLENQLLTGFKPVKEDGKMSTAPLTDKDRDRIKKEIETLKTRL